MTEEEHVRQVFESHVGPTAGARAPSEPISSGASRQERCGAARLIGGQEHRCQLDASHTGDHEVRTDRSTYGWKDPRSPMWRVGGSSSPGPADRWETYGD